MPKQPAQHLLGTPPVTHILPTVRASSTQYRAQIMDLTNLGQDRSGSSTLRDKSITIPAATISQVPGLGPYWPLQAAASGSARPIFSQEYLSPNTRNPLMMSLKSPEQSRGSGHLPTGGTSLGQETSGDILTGLNNSREEREVEHLALPQKWADTYSSSENELSKTGFLRQAVENASKC